MDVGKDSATTYKSSPSIGIASGSCIAYRLQWVLSPICHASRRRGYSRLALAGYHSSACSAALPELARTAEFPLKSVGGREKVSLLPEGVIAPCLPYKAVNERCSLGQVCSLSVVAPSFTGSPLGDLYLEYRLFSCQRAIERESEIVSLYIHTFWSRFAVCSRHFFCNNQFFLQ